MGGARICNLSIFDLPFEIKNLIPPSPALAGSDCHLCVHILVGVISYVISRYILIPFPDTIPFVGKLKGKSHSILLRF